MPVRKRVKKGNSLKDIDLFKITKELANHPEIKDQKLQLHSICFAKPTDLQDRICLRYENQWVTSKDENGNSIKVLQPVCVLWGEG